MSLVSVERGHPHHNRMAGLEKTARYLQSIVADRRVGHDRWRCGLGTECSGHSHICRRADRGDRWSCGTRDPDRFRWAPGKDSEGVARAGLQLLQHRDNGLRDAWNDHIWLGGRRVRPPCSPRRNRMCENRRCGPYGTPDLYLQAKLYDNGGLSRLFEGQWLRLHVLFLSRADSESFLESYPTN